MSSSAKRRLPAEWEPQDFVQLTLPHAGTDWADMLDQVLPCFLEITNAISLHQKVLIVCDEAWQLQAQFHPERAENVIYAHLPSNDTWARDHGGICIEVENKLQIIDFVFNGWGLKFPADKDNLITKGLADLGIFTAQVVHGGMVLEGGGIESDGIGTILTTSECLLSPNRNPHLSKKQIENKIKALFGAERVLWVNHGYLAGDDTDSHIDTLVRLCNPDTLCYVQCTDPEDEHFDALSKMEAELRTFVKANGKPYRLVALPMTDAIYDDEGNRLPATYANFLFVNDAVLLPIYGVPQDQLAIEIFTTLFPKHQIHPINCRPLIYQHGSLHCVTMQYVRGCLSNLV
jgi:agmatine deiminase